MTIDELVGKTFRAAKPGRYFASVGPKIAQPDIDAVIVADPALRYEVQVIWADDNDACINSYTVTAQGQIQRINKICRSDTLMNEVERGHLVFKPDFPTCMILDARP